MDTTTWYPGLIALTVGLLVAGGLVFWVRQEPDEQDAAEKEGRRRDLIETKAHTVEALRHLDLERSKLSSEDYTRERRALLSRGSDALRELETTSTAPTGLTDLVAHLQAERERVGAALFDQAIAQLSGTAPQRSGPSQSWASQIVLGIVACFLVLIGYGILDASRPRAEGESMTGVSMGSSDGPAVSPRRAQLEAQLASEPTNVGVLNQLTQVGLSDGDLGMAQEYNQRALAASPEDLDAQTFRGVLSALVGLPDRGLTYLDEVLAKDPNHPTALTYKGLIALEAGKPEIAVPALQQAIALQGPHPTLVSALERAQQGGGTAPAAPAEVVVSGEVTLTEAGEAQREKAQVVFIYVADPAQPRPPLAALKRDPSFPLSFTVTTDDAIPMAKSRGFPDEVVVTVRMDYDGNAFTQDDEIEATATVAKGTEGLSLSL